MAGLKREELFKGLTAAPTRAAAGAWLVERLGRGHSLSRRMKWPGGTLELELRVLTRDEAGAAYLAAMAACAKKGIDDKSTSPRAVEARTDEELVQILVRALRDVDGHALFASPDELASIATDDEIVALYEAYSDLRHEVDPLPDEMPEAEFQALEEALKKKDATLLSSIVSSMPRAWLRTSVLRLATSPTPSSSSTPGSSATSESTSPEG